jgi:phosphoglycolate phosphatase
MDSLSGDRSWVGDSDLAVDTVVLDLDGTLVDSVYEHVRAWKVAFQRIGVEVPGVRIHRAIGMGGDRLVTAVAGEQVEHGAGDEVRSIHDDLFADRIAEVRALPGAADLIRRIVATGRQAVLATSSKPDQVDRLLDLVECAHQLRHVVTSKDAEGTKPAPDVVEVALDRAGSRRAVVVGDSTWDVHAAARAGIPCLGVRSGGISSAELTEAGAVAVYEGPEELAAELDLALRLSRQVQPASRQVLPGE